VIRLRGCVRLVSVAVLGILWLSILTGLRVGIVVLRGIKRVERISSFKLQLRV
jgi:hypothetical protein